MFFFPSCLVAEKINIRQTFFFFIGPQNGPKVPRPNGAYGARRGGSGYGKIRPELDPLPFVHNAIMEPSNVKKKNKGTTKCDKRIVKCDVGIVQCEDGTIKCEKKVKEPPNVRKELSHVMLALRNVKMIPSNVRKKIREPPNVKNVQSHVMLVLHNVKMVLSNVRKNKRTTECDKNTVTCDLGTT